MDKGKDPGGVARRDDGRDARNEKGKKADGQQVNGQRASKKEWNPKEANLRPILPDTYIIQRGRRKLAG